MCESFEFINVSLGIFSVLFCVNKSFWQIELVQPGRQILIQTETISETKDRSWVRVLDIADLLASLMLHSKLNKNKRYERIEKCRMLVNWTFDIPRSLECVTVFRDFLHCSKMTMFRTWVLGSLRTVILTIRTLSCSGLDCISRKSPSRSSATIYHCRLSCDHCSCSSRTLSGRVIDSRSDLH